MPYSVQAEMNAPGGTRISLSATVEQAIANDEMIVNYRIQELGSSAATLRQKVNTITSKLEARLQLEKVTHQTTGRSLRPHWEKGLFNFKKWNLNQSGQIKTQDLEHIAGWLADIEAMGIKLNNLRFQVSSAKMRTVKDKLRLAALKKFRAEAAVLAKGLAAKSFRIIRIQTTASQPRYRSQPMMAEMSMLKSVRAPVVAAGESKSTLTVSGEIEVPFSDFKVR